MTLQPPGNILFRYTMAVLFVAFAVGLKFVLGPEAVRHSPFLLFSISVVVSAFYLGFGPALLASISSILLVDFFFLEPVHRLNLDSREMLLPMFVFLFEAFVVSQIVTAMRRSHQASQHDATRLRETELRLRASEQLYRTIAEAIPQLVWTARANGEFDYVNQRWIQYTSMSIEESAGFGWQKAAHTEDQRRIVETWQQCLAKGIPHEIEARFRRSDGAYRWFLGRAIPIRDNVGNISQWFGTLTDIDDQRRAAEEITRANVQLASARDEAMMANRVKTAFLANMSHELRTPLNAILGYSELMEEDAKREKNDAILPDLQRIHQAGQHLLTVINGILDISKIEAGKMELDIAEFRVSEVVSDVMAIIQTACDRGRNLLICNCHENTGLMFSDELKIRQMLFNLLSNACKFTENGTVTIECKRVQERGRDWIIFSIIDTGIGIAPEHLGLLFKEFSQIDPSFTRKYGGTGLGLAISQRFVTMLGGSIDVDSRKDVGSTFTVRLPAHYVKPDPQAATPPPDFE